MFGVGTGDMEWWSDLLTMERLKTKRNNVFCIVLLLIRIVIKNNPFRLNTCRNVEREFAWPQ